ncbi:aminotransferase class I/II-fold pyridoxal phosphate-dependent enzyme [Acidobacteriota bacterium]
MKIEHFKMERWQSEWENHVKFNLSESGVHPLSFQELVTGKELNEIIKTRFSYIQTDGTPELKGVISDIYPGSSVGNILVTTGSIEANFLLMWSTLEPGDEVIFMLPNFMQMEGLMRAFGANVKTFYLQEKLDWNPDLDELRSLFTDKTKLIVLTNPNNPTGGQLSEKTRRTIIEMAEKTDAWIISDEVYQGAEMNDETTPSFWGTYKKAIVSCGLSKAYGLPGLRVGWIVAPEDIIQKTWTYKDYTTITISALSDRLARIVLAPENRKKILGRTRQILKANFPILESWLNKQDGLFEFIPPKAGAIVFARYNLNIHSTKLAHILREKKSVLLCPGDQFEMDFYFRFGFGEQKEYLLEALSLVEEGFKEIRKA